MKLTIGFTVGILISGRTSITSRPPRRKRRSWIGTTLPTTSKWWKTKVSRRISNTRVASSKVRRNLILKLLRSLGRNLQTMITWISLTTIGKRLRKLSRHRWTVCGKRKHLMKSLQISNQSQKKQDWRRWALGTKLHMIKSLSITIQYETNLKNERQPFSITPTEISEQWSPQTYSYWVRDSNFAIKVLLYWYMWF